MFLIICSTSDEYMHMQVYMSTQFTCTASNVHEFTCIWCQRFIDFLRLAIQHDQDTSANPKPVLSRREFTIRIKTRFSQGMNVVDQKRSHTLPHFHDFCTCHFHRAIGGNKFHILIYHRVWIFQLQTSDQLEINCDTRLFCVGNFFIRDRVQMHQTH